MTDGVLYKYLPAAAVIVILLELSYFSYFDNLRQGLD